MAFSRFAFVLIVATSCATAACYGPAPRSVVGTESAADRGRSTGNAVDDEIIVTKIKSKLLADPEVSGLAIDVDSYKGLVTLRGVVKTGREADEAIRLARDTSGVRDVQSQLVVE